MSEQKITPRTPRELATSREFPYGPERVFRAFSDPEQLAAWWGPKGFTNSFRVFDFDAGGEWEFTMHGPNGADYLNESRFLQIEEPSRIVLQHLSAPIFMIEFDFEPTGAGTRVDFRQIFESVEDCERIAKVAAGANEENLDRLGEVLARSAG